VAERPAVTATRRERELLEFVVARAASDGAGAGEIAPETPLFREKILNSINILDLIGYVENGVGRRLTDDEIVMSNFESVRAIRLAFFNERSGEGRQAAEAQVRSQSREDV